eukprot:4199240-Prymnesium_polylepis.1
MSQRIRPPGVPPSPRSASNSFAGGGVSLDKNISPRVFRCGLLSAPRSRVQRLPRRLAAAQGGLNLTISVDFA